jgi:uncharacterized membrane protein
MAKLMKKRMEKYRWLQYKEQVMVSLWVQFRRHKSIGRRLYYGGVGGRHGHGGGAFVVWLCMSMLLLLLLLFWLSYLLYRMGRDSQHPKDIRNFYDDTYTLAILNVGTIQTEIAPFLRGNLVLWNNRSSTPLIDPDDFKNLLFMLKLCSSF